MSRINEDYAEYASFTIEALAELLLEDIEPAKRAAQKWDKEGMIERVKNAYCAILWVRTMENYRADGDRTVLDGLARTAEYEVNPSDDQVDISDITVVDLPGDAGIMQVIPVSKGMALDPLTKTNIGRLNNERKMKISNRYYRQSETIYFPDGLEKCTDAVRVIFLGVDSDEETVMSRTYADMTYDKVWQTIFGKSQIQADTTNNSNPNV